MLFCHGRIVIVVYGCCQYSKRLEKIHEEKMNKLKDEALGKLKDLGNSILGNFGMSLDNFKMTQDPNTGSWSINMNNSK
jgi:hypothetical protein